MPEAKNTFLKAKMNQDLDARLLPNGEYRTAQNILVGKSEDDSVGSIENIKGNELIMDIFDQDGIEVIGYLPDAANNRIFIFSTNFSGTGNAANDPGPSGGAIYCGIDVYNINSDERITLVKGTFLNFSTLSPILNINLLEDLLFWTDNRNQPRKINVVKALGNSKYYTKEHQISVAKYNPFESISLLKQEIEKIVEIIPTTPTTVELARNEDIEVGMYVVGIDPANNSETIRADEYITITEVDQDSDPNKTIVVFSKDPDRTVVVGDELYFLASTMTDQSENPVWPGDPSFLQNRFVRFGYRFKFDDNEYSIFSPFTQVAFIPKQKGYFLNGQEQTAINSTILEWFENSINNIDLIIPLPDRAYNVIESYKITEIEILYKESDQIPVKVVDTIPMSNLSQDDYSKNYYIYNYQSRKPIRTLPEAQTVRVFDKVPVRAKTQEVSGNRVMYGNFLTKHTPPQNINYDVSVQKKIARAGRTNFIEYPNHTVKQNRNYQVGFVLSDKYGRQSDVILSPVARQAIPGYSGSTVFAPYIGDDPQGSGDADDDFFPEGVLNWFGNSILMSVNSPITGSTTGLYATSKNDSGFILEPGAPTSITFISYSANAGYETWEYIFTLKTNSDDSGVPTKDYANPDPQFLRGADVDYVEVLSSSNVGNIYTVRTKGKINDIYLASLNTGTDDIKFTYRINELGWYSYKIVVKQTEQEYYNVYLPTAIAANNEANDDPLVSGSTETAAGISYITLINDNINKVPRDLSQVGPDQKQYRSSVKLFGRVQPVRTGTGFQTEYFNTQFYPENFSDVSTSVGNTNDLLGEFTVADRQRTIYQYTSNPIVARISTNKQFGENWDQIGDINDDNRFQLSIYETNPVVSNLDIYWETAQAGYISDLNWDVRNDFSGPVGWGAQNFDFTEDKEVDDDISGEFDAVDSEGNAINGTSISSFTVYNYNGAVGADVITGKFEIVKNTNTNQYKVVLKEATEYTYQSKERDVFKFLVTLQDNDPNSEWGTVELSFSIPLENVAPDFIGQTQPNPPTVLQEYYYFDDEDEAGDEILDFSLSDPENGSSVTRANQTGLVWTISGDDANLFNMNPATGSLTLTQAGEEAGNNTYNIDITLTDASLNPDTADEDALSITRNTLFVKGFPRTNVLAGGESLRGFSISSEFLDDNLNFLNEDYVAYKWYYLSDVNDYGVSDMPPAHSGEPGVELAPQRIGYELKRGSFIFGIEEARIDNYDFEANVPLDGKIQFQAFHRATPQDDWALVGDLNGYPVVKYDYEHPWKLEYISDYTDSNGNSTNNDRYYAWFSVGTEISNSARGEYAFRVQGTLKPNSEQTGEDYSTPFGIIADVYLRDLHYTAAQQQQQVYKFKIYTGGKATNADSASRSGTYVEVFSDNPLLEYNKVFYETAELADQWSPGGTSAFYYVAELIDTPYPGSPNNDRKARQRLVTQFRTQLVWGVGRIDPNGQLNSPLPAWKAYSEIDGRDNREFSNRATTGINNTYFYEAP